MSPPSIEGTNSPPMNKRVSIVLMFEGAAALGVVVIVPNSKFHRVRFQFAPAVHAGQAVIIILPDDEDRALGRISFVPDVGGHGGNRPGSHRDLPPRPACFAVIDVPDDLIGRLDKPLDTIVAVHDRKRMLFGG